MKFSVWLLVLALTLWGRGDLVLEAQSDRSHLMVDEGAIVRLAYHLPLSAGTPRVRPLFEQEGIRVVLLDSHDEANATHTLGWRRAMIYPTKSGTLHLNFGLVVGLPKGNDSQNYERFKDISAFNTLIDQTFKAPLTLQVQPHPPTTIPPLIGDMRVHIEASSRQVKPREPLRVKVVIEGRGNLDVVTLPSLSMAGVTIFQAPPQRDIHLEGDKRVGRVVFALTMTSEKSFDIPTLQWSLIDQTSTLRPLATNPLHITVTKEAALPLMSQETKGWPWQEILTVGIALGLVMFGVKLLPPTLSWRRPQNNQPKSLREKILQAQDDKALLSLLLPFASAYLHNHQIIEKLENNVYHGGKEVINREEIVRWVEEIVKIGPAAWHDEDPFGSSSTEITSL